MKVQVIYLSKFGNTEKVAKRIATELHEVGDIQCSSLEDLFPSDLEDCDLIIMGTPTHRMNLPEQVKLVFKTLKKRFLPHTPVAAFDTSYKMSWFLSQFTASRRLLHLLRKAGGKPIMRPETFHVVGREGPLYEGELERACQWTQLILKKMDVWKVVPHSQRISS